MKFHVDLNPGRASFTIDHGSKLVLLGSCFAENIGNLLREHLFSSQTNPAGITFNPVSLAAQVFSALANHAADERMFVHRGEGWYSLHYHSQVKAQSSEQLTSKIAATHKLLEAAIASAQVIFITFGTAHAYVHRQTGETAANCHKQPQQQFRKELLSVERIVEVWKETIAKIREVNPPANIVFTVSPVKYLKDGLVQNALSKAVLLLSAHQLSAAGGCSYFPAYELVSDDLRDHRFYKEDLAHPNAQAIAYVWEKLSATYFSDRTRTVIGAVSAYNKAKAHRQLHSNAGEEGKYREALKNLADRIMTLEPRLSARLGSAQ